MHSHSEDGQFGGTWWQFSLHHASVAPLPGTAWHVVPGPGGDGDGGLGCGGGGGGDGGGDGGVGGGEGGVGAAKAMAFAKGQPAC